MSTSDKAHELLSLAEQWERDAAGCRRDGYIDAAVVKEECAQRIRQTLGIRAIAEVFAARRDVQAGEGLDYDLAVLDDAAETLDRIGEGSAGLREARARIASALSQQPEARGGGKVEDGPIDASDNAEYIEHCADRLERCGLRVTAGALRVIAHEHRTLAQQSAAPTLAKHQPCGCVICTCEDEQQCQGCGAKHCGNRTDHPPYVAQQPSAEPRSTHRAWRRNDWLSCYCEALSDHHIGCEQPGSRAWMAEVCRAAALSLAAHGVRNDQLSKVADWIAQQPEAVECDCPAGRIDHASWCAVSKAQDAAIAAQHQEPKS